MAINMCRHTYRFCTLNTLTMKSLNVYNHYFIFRPETLLVVLQH